LKIRWCPSHQGIEGNEVAGEWAKLAADEPDAHGVEWFSTTNPDGTTSARKFPLPRSLANVKRGFSEQKRSDTRSWATRQLARTRNRKYRPSTRLKPDTSVAKTNKRLASRFYQVKTGHCLTGRHLLVVPVQDPDSGTPVQELPEWKSQQKTLWATVLEETRKLPGPTRGRAHTNIAQLLADERCSQAVIQFLATTDVGRTSGPPAAEDNEDAASEASEWEAREQEERAWERREEEERLGEEWEGGVRGG